MKTKTEKLDDLRDAVSRVVGAAAALRMCVEGFADFDGLVEALAEAQAANTAPARKSLLVNEVGNKEFSYFLLGAPAAFKVRDIPDETQWLHFLIPIANAHEARIQPYCQELTQAVSAVTDALKQLQ